MERTATAHGEQQKNSSSVPAPRLACLVVPLFPLAARLRGEPALKDEAVVLCEGNGTAAHVVAATRKARKAGIRPGFTLPQARALLPDLLARARDTESERAAQEALLDVAGTVSPRVEDAGDGVVYLDVDGLERLFPDERDLGLALIAAAKRESLPARCGLASSKLAARVAATLPDSPVAVRAGGEAAFLAPLPLAKLDPEAEIVETLARWGLASVGDLAKLSAADVASRLGARGLALHETARGRDPRPLVPRRPPPGFTEGMELEWPLVALEPFLALAEGALTRLARRLEAEAVGCARMDVSLTLEPEGCDTRSFDLPAPTRDVKTLLTLVRLGLEGRPPGAAVTGFSLTAQPDAPRKGQLTLFGPAEISPDRLATALAKLFALLGPGRVGAPSALDGYRPERFALVPFAPPPPPATRKTPRTGRGLLSVRVLRPPVPLEVLLEDERPTSLRALAPADGGGRPALDVAGAVRVASGPWRLEEGWWQEAPAFRTYWDVELSGGGLYRVFHDESGGEWFADGVYD
jgi:protein ImuB